MSAVAMLAWASNLLPGSPSSGPAEVLLGVVALVIGLGAIWSPFVLTLFSAPALLFVIWKFPLSTMIGVIFVVDLALGCLAYSASQWPATERRKHAFALFVWFWILFQCGYLAPWILLPEDFPSLAIPPEIVKIAFAGVAIISLYYFFAALRRTMWPPAPGENDADGPQTQAGESIDK